MLLSLVPNSWYRYRTLAPLTQAPTGCVGSCSPIDNSSEAVKTESTQNMVKNSNPAAKQGSNGSSDNTYKGSTTAVAIKSSHPSAFHPVQVRTSQPVVQDNVDDKIAASMTGQSKGAQCQYQVQHHYHHYHHHHHHVHSVQKQQEQLHQPFEHDDLSHKKMTTAVTHCNSANAFAGPVEGNAANYSIDGSKSGSNHGSNGQNGTSAAANVGADMEIANGVTENCGSGGGNGSGSGSGSGSASGVHQNRLAQREAALNKFRQKRKERNFGKKVSKFYLHHYI